MRNKDTYGKIKDKLINYEAEVPEECWKAIDSRLSFSRRKSLRKVIWYSAVAAVALVAVFTISIDRSYDVSSYTAEKQQEGETTERQLSEETTTVTINAVLPVNTNPIIASSSKAYVKQSRKVEAVNSVATIEPNDKNTDVESEEILTAENRAYNDTLSNSKDTKDAKYRELTNKAKKTSPIESLIKEPLAYNNNRYDKGISLSLVSANTMSVSADNPNHKQNPVLQGSEELSLYSSQEPLTFKHKMPISVGMTVEKRWKNRWGLETGLVYTLLRSSYSTESGTQNGDQELHYMGIPIQATYRFAQVKRFGFYAAVGPKIDINVAGKRTETAKNSKEIENYSEKIRDKAPQFSLLLRAGVSFSIIKHLDIYAEPSMAYYINNKGDIPDLWKDRPLNFVLQVGLRSSF